MKQFQAELDHIKEILKSSSHGMSVTEIARILNKNQHSVGRYLDILLVSGHVEMRMYGKAKVYSLSSRVPLNALMGGLHDLILVLDNENRIVRINDQFLRLIKKAQKDIVGKNISFIPLSEPIIETIFTSIRSSLESGLVDCEVAVTKKGQEIYRQKIIPTVFEDGESGTIVLLENITERKSAEFALRASEEQFRLMADNIQDGMAIYRDKKLTYANRRVEEIIGYSRDEFIRLSPLDITAPEDRDRIGHALDCLSSSNNIPSEVTFWIVRKDGTRRFVSCRITSLQQDRETILYIVITDMTKWKYAQDALENQLVFLQHMIDTFPNPLFYLDTDGYYLGCNSAFTRMTGKDLAEIAGKTNQEIGGFWESDLLERYNPELLEQPGIRNYTGVFHHPEGNTSKLTIQKSTMTSIEGTVAGIIGIVLSSEDLKNEGGD
jgi:PAS domain S-box-containing protein